MAILRSLILVNMGFLVLLGFWTVFSEPVETVATMRVLGSALVGLAVVLWVSSALSLVSDQRRLALLLSFANGLLAATALLQQAIWGSPLGRFLVLIPLSMAAALAWMGLKPVKPGEAAAELGALRIPDEIRQALLQQVGEAAAQEERNRLARDLHDSIKQQLFSINVGTATAQERWARDPEGAVAALADVRRSAREAMVEMQALLHHLRPKALGSIRGVIEALREQCEALGYRSGAEVTVELGAEIPDDRLPPGAPEALFRIAQEALANVARHARAHHVHLRLGRWQDEWAVLEVEDDGQGFGPEAEASGMGLRNLRERAESLQGILKIESVPGTGTKVTVWIPLDPFPSTGTSAIENEIKLAVSNLFATTYAVALAVFYFPRTPESNYLGAFFAFLLFGLAAWSWARKGWVKTPLAAPVDISRLRYARYRSQGYALFAGSSWACYIWSLTADDRNVWQAVWGATAILGAVLAGIELTRFHRQTRLRSAWPKWTWTSLSTYPNVFLPTFLIAMRIFPMLWDPKRRIALESRQLLWTLSVGALLAYLLARQPRVEEATE